MKKSELRPYLQKYPWLVKPVAWLLIIGAPVVLPTYLVVFYYRDLWERIKNYYDGLWQAATKKLEN